MSAFDTITIAVAAFLSGWFVGGLVKLEIEGKRRPLVRRFLFSALQSTLLLLCALCISWWLTYHHLPPWQAFIVGPFIASAGASVLVYRQEKQERFHIPSHRKRGRQTT
jgi:hypothetical protein